MVTSYALPAGAGDRITINQPEKRVRERDGREEVARAAGGFHTGPPEDMTKNNFSLFATVSTSVSERHLYSRDPTSRIEGQLFRKMSGSSEP